MGTFVLTWAAFQEWKQEQPYRSNVREHAAPSVYFDRLNARTDALGGTTSAIRSRIADEIANTAKVR